MESVTALPMNDELAGLLNTRLMSKTPASNFHFRRRTKEMRAESSGTGCHDALSANVHHSAFAAIVSVGVTCSTQSAGGLPASVRLHRLFVKQTSMVLVIPRSMSKLMCMS